MSRRSEPSPQQQKVVEALRRHGSVDATAAALGISGLNVDRTLSSYHRRVCELRIGELEEEVTRLRQWCGAEAVSERLERAVDRLERLPAVSHRRLADGGTRVRDQVPPVPSRPDG